MTWTDVFHGENLIAFGLVAVFSVGSYVATIILWYLSSRLLRSGMDYPIKIALMFAVYPCVYKDQAWIMPLWLIAFFFGDEKWQIPIAMPFLIIVMTIFIVRLGKQSNIKTDRQER